MRINELEFAGTFLCTSIEEDDDGKYQLYIAFAHDSVDICSDNLDDIIKIRDMLNDFIVKCEKVGD